jgi:hypothetical protein
MRLSVGDKTTGLHHNPKQPQTIKPITVGCQYFLPIKVCTLLMCTSIAPFPQKLTIVSLSVGWESNHARDDLIMFTYYLDSK